MEDGPIYGQTRKRRAEVSYRQIEEAALAILATSTRPTVEGVRERLKGGSPRTILDGLQRFWGDLAARVAELPDSRRRLPPEIADVADDLWQKALALALDAAQGQDTALRTELAKLKTDTEVRGHALAQRELEIEALVRSRERTIRELEEHLRATMSLVGKRDATIRALEVRLADSLAETEGYRQRLANVISQAATRHRKASPKGNRIDRFSPARPTPPAKRSAKKVAARKQPARKPKRRPRR